MTPEFELGLDFCTMHLPTSFIILCLLVRKQTNTHKQTRKQTNAHTHKHANKQTHTHKHANKQTLYDVGYKVRSQKFTEYNSTPGQIYRCCIGMSVGHLFDRHRNGWQQRPKDTKYSAWDGNVDDILSCCHGKTSRKRDHHLDAAASSACNYMVPHAN